MCSEAVDGSEWPREYCICGFSNAFMATKSIYHYSVHNYMSFSIRMVHVTLSLVLYVLKKE